MLYGYVANNPLSFIDPNGMDLVRIRVPNGSGGVQFAIVDSKIAKQAYEFAWTMYSNFGLVVGESYRTDEQQKNVSASGGMKAKVGKSRHQQGFAIDFRVKQAIGKKYKYKLKEKELLKKIFEIGAYADVKTLWDWRYEMNDYPHFELDAKEYGYNSREEAYEVNKKYYETVGGESGIPIQNFDSESKTIELNGHRVQVIQVTGDEAKALLEMLRKLPKKNN